MTILNLGDGTELDIDFDALTVSVDGAPSRSMTAEEIEEYAVHRPVNPADLTMTAKLDAALSVLRDAVADSTITDAELAAATPAVLGALELFSSYGEWDDAKGLDALRIVSRICHAILLRAESQGAQVKTSLTQIGQGMQGLTSAVTALSQRVTVLEEEAP
jgi:hypothetical protein